MLPMKKRFFVSMFLCFPLLLSATNVKNPDSDATYQLVNDMLNQILAGNNVVVKDGGSTKSLYARGMEKTVIFDDRKRIDAIVEPQSDDFESYEYSDEGRIIRLSSQFVDISQSTFHDGKGVSTEINGYPISSFDSGIKQFRNGSSYFYDAENSDYEFDDSRYHIDYGEKGDIIQSIRSNLYTQSFCYYDEENLLAGIEWTDGTDEFRYAPETEDGWFGIWANSDKTVFRHDRSFEKDTLEIFGHTYEFGRKEPMKPLDVSIDGRSYAEYEYSAVTGRPKSFLSQGKKTEYGYTDDELLQLSDGTASFQYDAFGRIVRYDNGSDRFDYRYDEKGNISVNDSFVYGKADEFPCVDVLLSDGKNDLRYDVMGNIVSHGNRRMTYTRGNVLSSYENVNTGERFEYRYDYGNKRIRKNKIRYIYDENEQIVSILDGADSMLFLYDQTGFRLGFVYQGAFYCYIYDGNGNVVSVIDSSGNQVAEYIYDAFGRPLYSSGPMAHINPFRYKGYFFDEESGYYYLKSRYYDPSICRFLSIDDVDGMLEKGYPTDLKMNLYAYCISNPVMNSDENGNEVAIVLTACAAMLAIASMVLGISLYNILNGLYLAMSNAEVFPIPTDIPGITINLDDIFDQYQKLVNCIWMVIVRALMIVKKRDVEYHHIIPKNARPLLKPMKKAREFCVLFLGSIDSDLNLARTAYQLHKVLHTQTYYTTIGFVFGDCIEKLADNQRESKFECILALTKIALESISFMVFGV